MPAGRPRKTNKHYTTYDIARMLKEAGFNPAGETQFDGRIAGYKVWRVSHRAGRLGIIRVAAANTCAQAERKAFERDYKEALEAQGVWIQQRGACLIIPQGDCEIEE